MHSVIALSLALLPTISLAVPTATPDTLSKRQASQVCTYHVYFTQSGYPLINSYNVELQLYAPRTDPNKQGKKLAWNSGTQDSKHWDPTKAPDAPAWCWSATEMDESFCIRPTPPDHEVENDWVLNFTVGNGTTFTSPKPADCPLSKKRSTTGQSTAGPNGMVVGCLDGGGQDGTEQDGADVSIDGSFGCSGNFS